MALVPLMVQFRAERFPTEGVRFLKIVGLAYPEPVTRCTPTRLFTGYVQDAELKEWIGKLLKIQDIQAAAPLGMVMEQIEKAVVVYTREHSV